MQEDIRQDKSLDHGVLVITFGRLYFLLEDGDFYFQDFQVILR